jgi:predicted Fe-S protein YdhL (DUF1289 family)
VQMDLSFLEIPGPTQQVWESLDDEQRQAVIDKVSRLIMKAALATQSNEEDADD